MKNLIEKAKRERWIQHIVLFITSAGLITWIRNPHEWVLYQNLIAYGFVGFVLAVLWEKFQVFVSGSQRDDIVILKWLHKLGLINLYNDSIKISWADVLVSTLGFVLGCLIVLII